MIKVTDDEAADLANEHIEWFLSMLRPLLFSHFVHGFKHGREDERRLDPGARVDQREMEDTMRTFYGHD